jgi:hypothetical protein
MEHASQNHQELRFYIRSSAGRELILPEKEMEKLIKVTRKFSKRTYALLEPFFSQCLEDWSKQMRDVEFRTLTPTL